MEKEIHFGTINLSIGDRITFNKTNQEFLISSSQGGTLVRYLKEEEDFQLYSLRLMTRKLMGNQFPEVGDIFKLWNHKGKTLREIHRRNNAGF